jgi:hypothetical protein
MTAVPSPSYDEQMELMDRTLEVPDRPRLVAAV